MLHSKKIVCVIPARLQASRFPRKLLSKLQDKPLLEWVWDAAKRVDFFDEVLFALDDEELASVVRGFQGRYMLTPKDIPSGTDRLVYVRKNEYTKADIWVNWQGDEPFISKKMIQDLLQDVEEKVDIWTLKKKITQAEEIENLHIAKVVTDAADCALYFSRSPIPCYRDRVDFEQKNYYKHVGLYACTDKALEKISSLDPTSIEEAEKLEQLRFLHYGLKIKVHTTQEIALGIDLPEHLVIAEEMIKSLVR